MNPSEYERLQQKFLELRDVDQETRENALEALQQSSPELVNQLRELLRNDNATDDFLQSPVVRPSELQDLETEDLKHDRQDADLPKMIGSYRVLQKIGEGGYGVVFMAEQLQPIRRRVAIKWVKPGMDSKMVLARFEAERQALAMMQHPSIANVIEADTTSDGRPYFVMELVHGHPIDRFCLENQLPLEQRLELFLQVCEAVHHAHRKGILHRDIKPANVLVTLNSGRPLAKVIDFGIAKALHVSLTERTMFTEYGQIIGTLEYMSPEQAILSEQGTDVRSDVYSLGVLLYLLLTDETPVSRQELLRDGIWEIKKTLQDSNPLTPSRRVTTGIESQRWSDQQTSPRSWLVKLRGELDWITMKALEKNPDSRYDSAADLAEDLRRFLAGGVVYARPPSLAYSLSKWLRRHRVAASILSTILASILIGLTAVSIAYLDSQKNLQLANDAIKQAEVAAEERSQALKESDQQRKRADETAARLAKLVKRSVLKNSWNEAVRGQYEDASNLLDQIPASERDFEWQLIERLSRQVKQPTLRSMSQGALRASCVHSSLGLLALVTTDSRLEIWDLKTQKHRTVQLGQQLVTQVAFSRDGSQLLLGGGGDLLQLIDVEDLKVVRKLNLRLGGIRDIKTQPESRNWVVATGADFLVQLSPELETLEQQKLPQRVSSVAWIDRERLAVGLVSGNVIICNADNWNSFESKEVSDVAITKVMAAGARLWALDSKNELWEVSTQNEGTSAVRLLLADISDFAPSAIDSFSGRLFVATVNRSVAILDPSTKNAVPISQHAESLMELRSVDAGQQLIGIHVNGRIDLINPTAIQRAKGLALALTGVTDAVPVGSEHVATGHITGEIKLWRRENAKKLASVAAHDGEVYHLTQSTALLASTGADNSLVLTDRKSTRVLRRWEIDWGVRCVQFLEGNQRLAGPPDRNDRTQLREGTFDIWDVEQDKPVRRCAGHSNWIVEMALAGDGRLLTNSVDGSVKLWDTNTGQCLRTFDKSQLADTTCMAYCPRSDQLLLGHQDGSVTAWELQTGEMNRRVVLRDAVLGICSSADEPRALIAGKNSPLLTCIETDTLAVQLDVDVGIGKLMNFRTSSDHRQLLLQSEDNAIRVWDLPGRGFR